MEQSQVEEFTSGASGRLIPVISRARRLVLAHGTFHRVCIIFQSLFLWFLLLLRRNRQASSSLSSASSSPTKSGIARRRTVFRSVQDDTLKRRNLAESLTMMPLSGGEVSCCRTTFVGRRGDHLFYRSWIPHSSKMKGILVIIHGLNEHSGRYSQFAKLLTACNFGVYAMDWIGHGGSDGLHGYVPSLDLVVADTETFVRKIKSENTAVPCFLFGHSTGGAVVLKASLSSHVKEMIEGVILTSPALRVKPAHPIVELLAPVVSVFAPRLQFKGANKRGIPVSRDPTALMEKYSDPLVYTGPIRARTGYEILRISSYLMQNLKAVTVPFLVLHGTADKVTDPLATLHLFNEAASEFKDIKLYEDFLHDLLFEPERDEVAGDIIQWMEEQILKAKHR